MTPHTHTELATLSEKWKLEMWIFGARAIRYSILANAHAHTKWENERTKSDKIHKLYCSIEMSIGWEKERENNACDAKMYYKIHMKLAMVRHWKWETGNHLQLVVVGVQ